MITIENMRFPDFERRMKKAAFTFVEARVVTPGESLAGLRLNLHRWVKRGDLVRIRRAVYAFPNRPCSLAEMIALLYSPAYVSLESALNHHGLLPDVPFEMTLVTPRSTRSFQTAWGRFLFHSIHQRLFFGYNPTTLVAEPEKALLDYFYLRGASMEDTTAFWQAMRFQNLDRVQWNVGDGMVKQYSLGRVAMLWRGLKQYAKTHRIA